MRLLQISGNQVWPNLLPILALKPSSCVYLTSDDAAGRYRKSAGSIHASCQAFGIKTDLEFVATLTENPTVSDSAKALEGVQVDCVNLTGGTKTMAIAAYEFARKRGIPAFYLDTRRGEDAVEIILGKAGEISGLADWKLAETTAGITVSSALEAHGFPVPDSFAEPTDAWLKFAVKAAEIRMDEAADQEIGAVIGTLRKDLIPDPPLSGSARKEFLSTPILPVPGSAWSEYLHAAYDQEIIVKSDAGFHLIDPASFPNNAAVKRAAEKVFKLLEGIWFELALLDHLRKQKAFSDICWSVEADHTVDSTASSRGETDLVAFDPVELVLHFISCKTSGPHGAALDHVQGLRGRASKEGGKFSKACLWIFRARNSGHRTALENHCREQNVTLRVFTDTEA